MTKADYLSQLKRSLRALPESEVGDALDYYDGYISDSGQNEDNAMKGLGSPREVAAKILAEFALKTDALEEMPKKHGLRIAMGVTLAVFAVPVGLPIAIAVAAVAFALLIVLFALVVSFMASGVALALGAVVSLITGFVIFTQSMGMAFMVLGSGLAALGIGVILVKAAVSLASGGFRSVARLAGKTILKDRGIQ